MKKNFLGLLASYCYIGYLPASGTFATFATIPLVILTIFLQQKMDINYFLPLITILLLIISIPISTFGEKIYGEKDPHKVVIDEIVGYYVTIVFFPYTNKAFPEIMIKENIAFYVQFFIVSFLLFRFFDVVKVYPANISQKLPEGWGIVIDDVIAGIYSALFLFLIFKYLL